MLIGRVVQDEVHEDANAATVRFGGETVKVRQRAETRIDVAVVHDVVAEVMHGRGIDRGQPDGVNAERVGSALQVVKPADDAGEVADPVPVGIVK